MKLTSLRERVIIQTRAYVPDQVGGHIISWADRGEIWAEVKPIKNQNSNLCYRLRWRVGTNISYLARLKWGERILKFTTRPQIDVYRRWVSAIVCEDGGEHE